MGISVPPPAVPQFPTAPTFTEVHYFDDMLYNTTLGTIQDYSGMAGLKGGTPPIAVDAAHPGAIWADLSLALPALQWMPAGSAFTLQQYASFTLEWSMQLVNPTAATRFQMELGMSLSSGCIQDSNALGVSFSLPGATCANTPTGNYYFSTDNGGTAQYLNTGVNPVTTQNVWNKFVIDWSASANRLRCLINDIVVASTTILIPSGVNKLPIFAVSAFQIGAVTGFFLLDYLKFDAVISR